jgi:hypothetical protein
MGDDREIANVVHGLERDYKKGAPSEDMFLRRAPCFRRLNSSASYRIPEGKAREIPADNDAPPEAIFGGSMPELFKNNMFMGMLL